MPYSKRVVTTTGTHYDTIPNGTVCGRDSFIEVKLFIYKVPTKDITVISCDSFVSPGGKKVWYSSGIYTDVLKAQATCDTALTVNLTINKTQYTDVKESACDSFISVTNKVYKTTGMYSDTLQAMTGCDSIIRTDLTINNSSFTQVTKTTCKVAYVSPSGKYIWGKNGTYLDTLASVAGCDSVLEIKLTVDPWLTDEKVASCEPWVSPSGKYTYTTTGIYKDTLPVGGGCDSVITIDFTRNEPTAGNLVVSAAINRYYSPSGQFVWNTSGTYSDTIPNVNGCDSVISVDLTIQSVDLTIDKVSTGATLKVNAAGFTYQWLDCDNNYAVIPGATKQTYKATKAGNYAVIVGNQWNTDTSACVQQNLGIASKIPSDIQVYPNPNNGMFQVDLGSLYNDVLYLQVLDPRAKVIGHQKATRTTVDI